MPKTKLSKAKMVKLRSLGIEKLKELVKEHDHRVAYAETAGDWHSIERETPAIEYCEKYIKLQEKKKEEKRKKDENVSIDTNLELNGKKSE